MAQKAIAAATEASSGAAAGWAPSPNDVPIGDYGTDYFVRTLVSNEGFGANRAEFAVYQNTATDKSGKALSGAEGAAYSLTFPPGELPPVDGFWSVTVYDAVGYLTANDFGRYALGSNSGLVVESSGEMVLTFSRVPPDAIEFAPGSDFNPEQRRYSMKNWLPVPDGPFQLTLRLYGPSDAVLTEE